MSDIYISIYIYAYIRFATHKSDRDEKNDSFELSTVCIPHPTHPNPNPSPNNPHPNPNPNPNSNPNLNPNLIRARVRVRMSPKLC